MPVRDWILVSSPMKFVLPGSFIFLALTAMASADECSRDQTTQDIVECIDRQTRAWDKKLNEAYQAQMQAQQGAQRTRLLKAERLWIQYRDANCGFYAGGEGSISRIQAADCLFKMTRGRAQELESGELP
jgi:uncharacterized protein YecT (DUF1311 family)